MLFLVCYIDGTVNEVNIMNIDKYIKSGWVLKSIEGVLHWCLIRDGKITKTERIGRLSS